MALTPSLAPIHDDQFGLAEARHLLRRAGFGGRPGQAHHLARLGLDQAVERLVTYGDLDPPDRTAPPANPDTMHPPTRRQRRALRQARRNDNQQVIDAYRKQRLQMRRADRREFRQLQRWWLQRMIETPRPLEENLTLLWHGHFATRYRNVRDAYMMQQQHAFLRANANTSFVTLAAGIVRDPAMIKFLNNNRNYARNPNENLARELMELFTLGEGQYTERDIKQAARALTGYHIDDDDFLFRRRAHDGGEKRILGRTAEFDGDALVRHLLRQRACWVFIAFKLYRHFVADVGDTLADVPRTYRTVILDLARELRRHEYALKPVLRTLFKSRHFYDARIIGRQIKSPVQLAVGTIRALDTPVRSIDNVHRAMRLMGQELFNPPSVAGWDSGRAWINTSTLFARQNLCTYLITGKHPRQKHWTRGDINYDPLQLIENQAVRTDEAIVNFFVDELLGDHIPDERRAPLVKFMRQRDKGLTRDSIAALLLLITAMPEYQLC